MKLSPISQNQYNSKNPSFNAVNQKYLKKAMDEYKRRYPRHNQGYLIECIDLDVVYGILSFKDGIDTLNAIKPYAKNSLKVIDDMIENMNNAMKQEMFHRK